MMHDYSRILDVSKSNVNIDGQEITLLLVINSEIGRLKADNI